MGQSPNAILAANCSRPPVSLLSSEAIEVKNFCISLQKHIRQRFHYIFISFVFLTIMSFLWFLGIPVGAVLILKTEWFVQNFGKVAWAEEHLGFEGGTRLFYKLLGLAVILVSLLGFTGGVQGIILSIFAPMFRAGK